MAGMICRQPNGRLCRFSTVVGCITHYNMTDSDYRRNITKTVKSAEDAQDTIDNYIKPFDWLNDYFVPNNMSREEHDALIKLMSETPTECSIT